MPWLYSLSFTINQILLNIAYPNLERNENVWIDGIISMLPHKQIPRNRSNDHLVIEQQLVFEQKWKRSSNGHECGR